MIFFKITGKEHIRNVRHHQQKTKYLKCRHKLHEDKEFHDCGIDQIFHKIIEENFPKLKTHPQR